MPVKRDRQKVTISPMRIRDSYKASKLREVLRTSAPSSEDSSLCKFIMGLCFILSCNETLRRAIYKVSPRFSFITLVARKNNTIIGVAWLQGRRDKEVLAAGITIFPEYQSNNIGTLLDLKREEVAREWGARSLEVTTLANNYKNLGLAEKHGYTAVRIYLRKDL